MYFQDDVNSIKKISMMFLTQTKTNEIKWNLNQILVSCTIDPSNQETRNIIICETYLEKKPKRNCHQL